MKWLVLAVAIVAVLAALVLFIGSRFPREHTASSAATFRQPPDSVWAAIRDLAAVPSWSPDVKQSVRLPDQAGRERWQQTLKNGFAMPLIVEESRPPARLVTRIDPPAGAAFGGSWTYDIQPAAEGTRLTITENGWIANLMFRFMANVFFGVHGTMDGYLRALGRTFHEEVEPEHLR